MMMFYDLFYQKFGIRQAGQMVRPPLPLLDRLELPKRSILHYTTDNPLSGGPASDDYLFRNVVKPVQMQHVFELGTTLGQPRKLPVSPDALARKYHTQHRRFRPMRDLEQSSRDEQTLIVYNYGFLSQLYRYMRSFYSEYYKWMNEQAAVWKNIAAVAKTSDRNQFVVCTLPKTLPSIPDLRTACAGVSQRMVNTFNSGEALMLLELWKWFGPERADSLVHLVDDKHLDRVNVVFTESGHWFVMNLGVVNSWRQATLKELEANPEANRRGVPAGYMQQRFLRLMMSLMHVRTEAAPEVDALADAEGNAHAEATPGQELQPQDKSADSGAAQAFTVDEARQAAQDAVRIDTAEDAEKSHTEDKLDQHIEADLRELETISRHTNVDETAPPKPVIEEEETLEQGVMNICNKFAEAGMLSAAEYRRYEQLSRSYRELPAPHGEGTLAEFIQIPQHTLKIEKSPTLPVDIKTVTDKSMLSSSLLEFDQKYIKHVMQRDVAGMVMNLQRGGLTVTNFEVEKVDDILGSWNSYTVRVVPVDGAASTFRFKLPVLDDEGNYMANGVKYRMRKQRGDLPIRKVGPDRVALTSYYGKLFVARSPKRVNDYGQWLRNQVMAKGLDDRDVSISNLYPADVFDNEFKAPKVYQALARGFRAFTATPKQDGSKELQSFDLNFDYTQREKLYGGRALATYEKGGGLIIGQSHTSGAYLVLDDNGAVYLGQQDKLVDIGTIETILSVDAEKAPVDFAEIKVLGRTIPVGVVLAYQMGLTNLMKLLKVEPRRVPAGQRASVGPHEYSLVFSDETLVFERDDKLASMVLGGFNEYHRAIRVFAVHEFDKAGVYFNVLEAGGAATRYLRELDLLYRLYIDPITRDLLVEMQEPTNFRGLLQRACEMLLSDDHPDELDAQYMRIKGYERMAGAVYSEIISAVRAHNGRTGKSRMPIDLNPYAVWKLIAQDPAVMLVQDINPVENLKDLEAVTYSGVGGRGSRSMTKRTRMYHKNDMGTISESTKDSGDVGINTYTSADPQFTSLRGMSRRYKIGHTGAAALLSTSALVSPGSDRDDPKRVNFIGIQMAHTVACDGYEQAPVRTGYEQVIPHRTNDNFALTAKKPGRVVALTAHGMQIEYADGELKGIELGRRYGNSGGLTIPHEVVTDLKEGQEFKAGDPICYNPGFFEKDVLNPSQLVMKNSVIVRTALMESTQTLEDSSAISKETAELLTTKMTKVKDVVVSFDQSVRKIASEGQRVESEDILCIIEDAVTANAGLFDQESFDTLRVLSNQTPQAKCQGVIERVEAYYHGDKEDMSETLRQLVTVTDRELAKRCRAAGKPAFTGSVDDGFRIDGDPLALDTLAIRFYITTDVPAGVGDKGVFCNQMKTVFGEIMQNPPVTESGKVCGAVFGQKSIDDRIVLSPGIIGTTTTLLDVIAKKAVAAYYGRD